MVVISSSLITLEVGAVKCEPGYFDMHNGGGMSTRGTPSVTIMAHLAITRLAWIGENLEVIDLAGDATFPRNMIDLVAAPLLGTPTAAACWLFRTE